MQKHLRRREQGFTLIELIVVMMIIAILTAIAVPRFTAAIQNAREAALKEDLHVMRDAIDAYTMDKGKAPQSLDDLVQAGYLRAIPTDPMTHSSQTWVTDSSDTLMDVNEEQSGIDDVHSGSDATGSNGKPYSSW
ncbi:MULTISPECIES: type II secretion system protein [Acidobacterium]|uniref:Prepilin-type N-terminal cleavage/methylation domain protein n=1 Tax=Acidobacterium capsulatum (strain ATCC 51196 / DSM 11244 / BCRC 80197 / JCM 7670 / NBRC 15755 / NCIMB 13165 / 161) TaxID=240015 RepID=C1F4C1_ACIC5|nr:MULTISPECIES: type II secretion system protein [Acidobacterium]ACO33890.1 prepilin-type N-terminal cleavage/methylation domain protein [Acidobacterium capsulatum ATCC 51196]